MKISYSEYMRKPLPQKVLIEARAFGSCLIFFVKSKPSLKELVRFPKMYLMGRKMVHNMFYALGTQDDQLEFEWKTAFATGPLKDHSLMRR